jgi:carboxymethylenebutenolidase
MWRIVKKVLLGFLAVVLVVVVFLAGLIIYEGTQGNARLNAITNTRIPNLNGPEIRAYVARPSKPGPHPAVIMIHEFFGLNEDIIGKAQALADVGYVVVAPDVFRGSTTQQIPRAIFQVITNGAEQVNTDVDAVMAWLASQPDVQADRIGIMGFCFGGRTSLLYSLHNNQIAATAVLYGNPVIDAERLKSLPGPVLGIFGEVDQSIPLDSVRKFEAALNEASILVTKACPTRLRSMPASRTPSSPVLKPSGRADRRVKRGSRFSTSWRSPCRAKNPQTA